MQNEASQAKFHKFGSRGIWDTVYCFILHSKMMKTIKFECIFFSLETFLESLKEIHVKKPTLKLLWVENIIEIMRQKSRDCLRAKKKSHTK